jgi:transposase-like protein
MAQFLVLEDGETGGWSVDREALRTWVKRAETDEGVRPGTTSGDAARIAELEREAKRAGRRGVRSLPWSVFRFAAPKQRQRTLKVRRRNSARPD